MMDVIKASILQEPPVLSIYSSTKVSDIQAGKPQSTLTRDFPLFQSICVCPIG